MIPAPADPARSSSYVTGTPADCTGAVTRSRSFCRQIASGPAAGGIPNALPLAVDGDRIPPRLMTRREYCKVAEENIWLGENQAINK